MRQSYFITRRILCISPSVNAATIEMVFSNTFLWKEIPGVSTMVNAYPYLD